MHDTNAEFAKEIRRERFVAFCILGIAVACLIYVVVIQLVLPEGTDTVGYTVPGFIFMTIFALVGTHHYITGVWLSKRALRRKTGK